LVQVLLGGAIAGLVCGGVDAAWLLRRNVDSSPDVRIKLRAMGLKFAALALSTWAAVILVFGLLSTLVRGTVLGDFLSLGQGAQVGLILGLCCGWIFAFAPDDARQTLSNDIQTVERLSWSGERARRGALLGVLIGIAAGVVASFVARFTPLVGPIEERFGTTLIVVLIMVLLAAFFIGLAGLLLGGIRGSVIESGKLRPNQGFIMSLINVVVTGPVIGAVFGGLGALSGWLIGGVETVLTMGLYGIFFGVIAAFWYGGFFAVQHLTLRFLLWRAGYTPPLRQFALFLDDACRRVFLRKVGGGYMFINRYLQAHFEATETLNQTNTEASSRM
jgi:eukaryotic-like serine/threonine-protein kinase